MNVLDAFFFFFFFFEGGFNFQPILKSGKAQMNFKKIVTKLKFVFSPSKGSKTHIYR